MVDANDEPALDGNNLPENAGLIHLPPPEDDVAVCVGRGIAKHLFYWRHSPQVLDAIGSPDGMFDVHADCDMLFLRPFDLVALVSHLEQGRVAMAIDRSTQDYYQYLENAAVQADTAAFPFRGSRGPMVQGGLIFRNPRNDGGLLSLLWEHVCRDARSGGLGRTPWDDMAYLSNMLGHNGALWGRLLPLGHEWNFISHDGFDGGVFSYVAHYGGSPKNVDFIVRRFTELFPAVGALQELLLWQREPDIARVNYGRVGIAGETGYDALKVVVNDVRHKTAISLHPSFSATWRVPLGSRNFAFTPALNDSTKLSSDGGMRVRLLFYSDGEFRKEFRVMDRVWPELRIAVRGAETITMIGVTNNPDYCHFVLLNPRWE